jgi:molybdopterin-synthase adenylyltransferase
MDQRFNRYHRQMLVSDIGQSGQQRLAGSTVLLLGCGALGSVSAELLARAGVGHLIIADRDFVELTNLQRQLLFDEQDVTEAMPKAEAARRRIARINSSVRVTAVVDDVNAGNIDRHARDADIIVDGLDNFQTRYLANDWAVKHGVPYIYGGAVATSGIVFAVLPHTPEGAASWETGADGSLATPCLRCLFEEPPAPGSQPTCDTVGVLGPVTAIVAAWQSAEALKVLTGNFARVSRTLNTIDLWSGEVAQLAVGQAAAAGDCICCGQRRFEFLDEGRGTGTASLCGRDAVQLTEGQRDLDMDLDALAVRMRPHADVRVSRYMLRAQLGDAGGAYTLSVFPDGRAIVHGTSDPAVARGIYARYIGN